MVALTHEGFFLCLAVAGDEVAVSNLDGKHLGIEGIGTANHRSVGDGVNGRAERGVEVTGGVCSVVTALNAEAALRGVV